MAHRLVYGTLLLLLMTFSNGVLLNNVERILRLTYRLRGERCRILRDLNQEDRLRMRAAVDELKCRKAAGETDLVIHNFLVVKRPAGIRWKAVFLVPVQQQILGLF